MEEGEGAIYMSAVDNKSENLDEPSFLGLSLNWRERDMENPHFPSQWSKQQWKLNRKAQRWIRQQQLLGEYRFTANVYSWDVRCVSQWARPDACFRPRTVSRTDEIFLSEMARNSNPERYEKLKKNNTHLSAAIYISARVRSFNSLLWNWSCPR